MGLALSLRRDKLRFDRAEWKLKSIPGGKKGMRDFPGGPVVRTLCFHCRGPRFNPWLGQKKKEEKGMNTGAEVGMMMEYLRHRGDGPGYEWPTGQ